MAANSPPQQKEEDAVLIIFKMVLYFFLLLFTALLYKESLKFECQKKMIEANRTAEDIIAVCGE